MYGITDRKDVGGYCPVLNHWLAIVCQKELESDYQQQPEPRPEKSFCVSGDPSCPAMHLPARTSPVRGLISFLLNLLLSPETMKAKVQPDYWLEASFHESRYYFWSAQASQPSFRLKAVVMNSSLLYFSWCDKCKLQESFHVWKAAAAFSNGTLTSDKALASVLQKKYPYSPLGLQLLFTSAFDAQSNLAF